MVFSLDEFDKINSPVWNAGCRVWFKQRTERGAFAFGGSERSKR